MHAFEAFTPVLNCLTGMMHSLGLLQARNWLSNALSCCSVSVLMHHVCVLIFADSKQTVLIAALISPSSVRTQIKGHQVLLSNSDIDGCMQHSRSTWSRQIEPRCSETEPITLMGKHTRLRLSDRDGASPGFPPTRFCCDQRVLLAERVSPAMTRNLPGFRGSQEQECAW